MGQRHKYPRSHPNVETDDFSPTSNFFVFHIIFSNIIFFYRSTSIHPSSYLATCCSTMPRFRSFVQHRLARETTGIGGSISTRRQFPSLDRKLRDRTKRKKVVSLSSSISFASEKENTDEDNEKKLSECATGSKIGADPRPINQQSTSKILKSKSSQNVDIVESRDDAGDEENETMELETPIDDELREKLSPPVSVTKSQIEDDTPPVLHEPIETNEDESTILTVQETFSSFLVLDSNLAILRSKEEVLRVDSHEDAAREQTISFSVASVETEISDLGSLARFFRFFECAAEGWFEYENGAILLQKEEPAKEGEQASKPNNLRRYYMTGDKIEEIKENYGDGDDTSHNNRSIESISSAISSPSRRGRRSFRIKSPSNEQEVDCMIEISAPEPKTEDETFEGRKERNYSADLHSQQDLLDDSEKNEQEEENNASPSPEGIAKTGFESVTTVPCSGRASPTVLRDQQTMLPDNLPPMARLRYCSHIGGKYGLLVTKERCYV